MLIEENVARLRERIERAAKKSGRTVDAIALMAVSKTIPPERIREAYQAGLRLFGENRVQEFSDKSDFISDLHGAEWHLIGHLQSNKAARATELFNAVDSVDSLRLAEKLNAAAEKLKKRLPILIEVNVGGEEAKSGVAPISNEMEGILRSASQMTSLEILGLMTVPPLGRSADHARPYFRMLRELRDEIAARKLPRVSMDELSMGMSHDFEVAIEEGSTAVRIGTAIFGARLKQPNQSQ